MEFQVGEKASISNTITSENIKLFAEISGDNNAIHLDEECAKKSIFGKRIAQGLLVSSYISAVIANKLPGPGSIYLGQELKFLRPVFIDDVITTTVEILDIQKKGQVQLSTICKNQLNDTVISGTALIKVGRK